MAASRIRIFKDFRAFDWVLVCGVTVCTVIYSSLSSDSLLTFDWLGTVSAVTGMLSVVLATHASLHAYTFGLVNVITYAIVSYKSNVLGDCLLYAVYYLPMQVIGWIAWSRHTLEDDATTVTPRRMSGRARAVTALLSVLAVAALGLTLYWLRSLTAEHPFIERWHLFSRYPFIDAVTTVSAAVGQYLMVKAFAEQWILWIAVDAVSLFLWSLLAAEGTPHSAVMVIMYVFYLANCVNGARLWNRSTSVR